MKPSEGKRKHFSRLLEEEIQNLIEGKDSENTRKATFLAYWNKVEPDNERVESTESLEIISKKEMNELLANFWQNAKKQNGDSNKNSALMGIRFGLQRHFLLKREFDMISDGEFSKSNQIFDSAIVELKRQGFSRVDHHSTISKEDWKDNIKGSLFSKLLMNWTKPPGQTINQINLQGKDVFMKDLRVPSVQLKLFNFIYLS